MSIPNKISGFDWPDVSWKADYCRTDEDAVIRLTEDNLMFLADKYNQLIEYLEKEQENE
jgi:hypothetical protein